jgi:hypothetical protein
MCNWQQQTLPKHDAQLLNIESQKNSWCEQSKDATLQSIDTIAIKYKGIRKSHTNCKHELQSQSTKVQKKNCNLKNTKQITNSPA